MLELEGSKVEVTSLRTSPDKIHLAVGFIDGSIEIFNLKTRLSVSKFSIHKSAVSVLKYDSIGMKLASGGNDTDVAILDIVSQQGIRRLIGHSKGITDVVFYEKHDEFLISSSKDMLIKFWNIDMEYCFKTVVDNQTEVWGLSLINNDSFLVSGSRDDKLNVYKLTKNEVIAEVKLENENESFSPINCNLIGTIQRSGKGRTVGLVSDPSSKIIACFGTNNEIEMFYFVSESESLSRLTKRLKKLKVKDTNASEEEIGLADQVRRLASIKTNDKIKYIDVIMSSEEEIRVSTSLADNSIWMYSLKTAKKEIPVTMRSIIQPGHHSEVRSVCFSSDNLAVASGAGDGVKIWNLSSANCLRTVETGYVLTICFAPGDRHLLVGLKNGHLLIVDIVVGEILEDIPAHEKELWAISVLPDLRGCVTGGGDSTVKIWNFELIDQEATEEKSGGKVLSLLHQSTMTVDDNVLSLKISGNSKFIACALLDSTVKIYFLDSFKFYLSLYGHKLPVLCMDISYDNSLIVTGSADRNVKIWGMDFGDCHKSLFAHDDSVMGLQFIPKTHMFFTCGKDGKIKQWDADNFQKILTISGHIGEAYGLTVSPSGYYVATCGSDRMVRMFERTDEIIVLQDAQEEEREELANQTLATGSESNVALQPGLKLPSKKTIGAEKGAESILECLELCEKSDINDLQFKNIMLAYNAATPDEYLISVLSRIRASDLEESLLILPFSSVVVILTKFADIIDQRKDQTELLSKIIFFLFRIHQKPIVSNQTILPIIRTLTSKLNSVLSEFRDMVGENYYGLRFLQKEFEIENGVELFSDAAKAVKLKEKKQKKRELKKRLYVHVAT